MTQVRGAVVAVGCALASLWCSGSARADGMLLSWSPRDLEGMSEARWEAAKKRPAAEVLALNVKLTSWPEAYEVLLGAKAHETDRSFLRALVGQLSNTATVKLSKTSRLIMWERITAGDIMFEGKGVQVDDDVFSVAGRANWVLTSLLGKRFGTVRISPAPADLRALAANWTQELDGGKPKPKPPAYDSKKKGLDELRSPAAIEALIASLPATEAKSRLTSDCLKRLYNLDALPKDPESPASNCSPDNYTHMYLASITDVTGAHDATWWKGWWQKNAKALQWRADEAKFVVPRAPASPKH
jgi:hypothetical protein